MIKIGNTDISKIYVGGQLAMKAYLGSTQVWPSEQPVVDTNCLKFTALDEPGELTMFLRNSGTYPNLEYSYNGSTWTNWADKTSPLTYSANMPLYIRGVNSRIGTSIRDTATFVTTSDYKLSGHITSLLDGVGNQRDIPSYAFAYLFYNNEHLINAEELVFPEGTYDTGCCYAMFIVCHGIEKGPKSIPAASIGWQSCYSMFRDCPALTVAPELPCLDLGYQSYYSMFSLDTSLVESPVLPAENPGNAYNYMFWDSNIDKITCLATNTSGITAWTRGVAPVGTFIKKPGVDWPIGENGIPTGWIVQEYSEGGFVRFRSVSPDDLMTPRPNNVKINSTEWLNSGYETYPHLQYSLDDGISWTDAGYGENIRVDDTICIRGIGNEALAASDTVGTHIIFENIYASETGDAVVLCEGEIVHLLDKDIIPETYETAPYAFANLFASASNSIRNTPSITCASAGYHAFYQAFRYIPTLKECAELNIPALGEGAYKLMFAESGILASPAIFAEMDKEACYQMFWHATSLKEVGRLDNAELAESCYYGMFNGCTSLDDLDSDLLSAAMTMKPSCYNSMFYNCTGLSTIPFLPAETLDSSCYYNMFAGCTGLSYLGNIYLTAQNIPQAAYYQMFQNCTGLTVSPEIGYRGEGETVFGKQAMYRMFRNDAQLSNITVLFENIPDSTVTTQWVQSVASFGTMNLPYMEGSWGYGVNAIPMGWNIVRPLDRSYYLAFTALDEPGELTLLHNENAPEISLEYSHDGKRWQTWDYINDAVSYSADEPVYLRGNNDAMAYSNDYVNRFVASTRCKISGHLTGITNPGSNEITAPFTFAWLFAANNTLIYADELILPGNTTPDCYRRLFSQCWNLETYPDLGNPDLSESCYAYMFRGTGITTAPYLPSTELAAGCYEAMFYGCPNLEKSPVLPATDIAPYAYRSMFRESANLNEITCLAVDGVNAANLHAWVQDVAAEGTFIKDANAEWPTGVDGIPENWSVINA